MTPLMLAAWGGHLEVVTYLVTHGSQLENTDKFGMTPLMFAAWGGHLEVVTYLVTHGSQLDVTDEDGLTALHYAARNGRIDITKLLIDQGCSPWVKTKQVTFRNSYLEYNSLKRQTLLIQKYGLPLFQKIHRLCELKKKLNSKSGSKIPGYKKFLIFYQNPFEPPVKQVPTFSITANELEHEQKESPFANSSRFEPELTCNTSVQTETFDSDDETVKSKNLLQYYSLKLKKRMNVFKGKLV
ncbi:unnamed protein product [Mytilus coruscus]|uniref:Uncharacterized protein n=1 Tax=Mytilus coruscus TaxID=42192 RepID=A0A6J8CE69_MYTCO|nr:unnamed protein product [Mytilus coruscus]